MRTFLTNCRLVDGTGQSAAAPATVVIAEDRIAWCGAPADPAAPLPEPDDRVTDLRGLTVLPGLFNVHAHLGLRLPFPERRTDQIGRAHV